MLNDEICRLSVLVDEFNVPFNPETLCSNIYKRELDTHIESGLECILLARLSVVFAINIAKSQKEIRNRMSKLLPENELKMNMINRGSFEIVNLLRCDNQLVFGDFHEQLEFQFSWGLSKLITHVLSLPNWLHSKPAVPGVNIFIDF